MDDADKPIYTVIEEDDLLKLAESVNELMWEGWKPLGGVAIGQLAEFDMKYCQALIFVPKEE